MLISSTKFNLRFVVGKGGTKFNLRFVVGKGALTNNLILIANHSTCFSHSIIINFLTAVLVVASLYDLQVK